MQCNGTKLSSMRYILKMRVWHNKQKAAAIFTTASVLSAVEKEKNVSKQSTTNCRWALLQKRMISSTCSLLRKVLSKPHCENMSLPKGEHAEDNILFWRNSHQFFLCKQPKMQKSRLVCSCVSTGLRFCEHRISRGYDIFPAWGSFHLVEKSITTWVHMQQLFLPTHKLHAS